MGEPTDGASDGCGDVEGPGDGAAGGGMQFCGAGDGDGAASPAGGHGMGDGCSTCPPGCGATNDDTLVPFTASFMNRCHMVAGRDPPVTLMPWTLVISGIVPSALGG